MLDEKTINHSEVILESKNHDNIRRIEDKDNQIEWKISDNLVDYENALAFMEERVNFIIENTEKELIWFLEHNPVYTAGTSSKEEDLIDKNKFPVIKVGRGGKYTYHGPGMLVCYILLNLSAKSRQKDVRQYVFLLEQWIIDSLKQFGINGERREGRVGIWAIDNKGKEEKIAAIGVRIKKWVSFHGIAININPNLADFSGIVPCGISGYGVTSMEKLGITVSKEELIKTMHKEFYRIFRDFLLLK